MESKKKFQLIITDLAKYASSAGFLLSTDFQKMSSNGTECLIMLTPKERNWEY